MKRSVTIIAITAASVFLIASCGNLMNDMLNELNEVRKAGMYTVTYDGNGSTAGSVPEDAALYAEGETVTVPGNTGGLVKTGSTFAGWNTAADGSGSGYAEGDTFPMGTADVTLFANWSRLNNAKEINSFLFTAANNPELSSDVTAIINGTEITATLPYGTTDLTGLVATFAITGESVHVNGTLQTSGSTTNNFTNPVMYTVTAADGTTLEYRVTALIAAAAVEKSGFTSAADTGDAGVLTLFGYDENINMVYANNQTGITFPCSLEYSNPVDNQTATLNERFFMGETEVTNGAMVAVLQWVYDDGNGVPRFSDNGDDHNGITTTTIKYGGQELLDLDRPEIKISYDGAGTFSVDSGYENHPVTCISWYGAVIFCNWLTEMRDGNDNNVVYAGISSSWNDDDTIENTGKNGYRLPSSEEWEYAARFLGTSIPVVDDLASEYIARNHNGGDNALTSGYYWTPADYASGATSDYTSETACREVSVYDYTDPDPYSEAQQVKSLGASSTNTLGLYDMSGNVREWCFNEFGTSRVFHTGIWGQTSGALRIGFWLYTGADIPFYAQGFRICRTRP